jgi:hypothetical protein
LRSSRFRRIVSWYVPPAPTGLAVAAHLRSYAMLPFSPALLQVAIEYGAATQSARQAAGGAATTTSGDDPLSHILSALPVPPWVIGLGLVLLWLFTRGRSSGARSPGGALGTVATAVIGLVAAFALARWRHLL